MRQRGWPRGVAGKTVIDVTNPLDMCHGMPPVLVAHLSNTHSAGEALQAALCMPIYPKATDRRRSQDHSALPQPV